jgi:hypothetical protein
MENHFCLFICKLLELSMSVCAASKITTSLHTEFEFLMWKMRIMMYYPNPAMEEVLFTVHISSIDIFLI